MLDIRDLVVHYDGAVAVDGVTLSVAKGEMVALIGPNGAGKSSLLKAAAGLVKSAGGTVNVGGRLAYVPEGRELFKDLTVEQNLRLGAWPDRHRTTETVFDLLPEIRDLRARKARTLSGGQQQLVAIARGLMARPNLLAIDELSLGLSPIAAAQMVERLNTVHTTTGVAMLIVEQSASVALGMTQRAYVMEAGRIVGSGESESLRAGETMRDSYLGMNEGDE